jgi:hypothetical protein
MENVVHLSVHLSVKINVGKTWGNLLFYDQWKDQNMLCSAEEEHRNTAAN